MDPNEFSNRLQDFRRAAQLTQEELAARAGYSVSYLRKLEQGTRKPSLASAETLARVLQLSPTDTAAFKAACMVQNTTAKQQQERGPGGDREIPRVLQQVLTMTGAKLRVPRSSVVVFLALLSVLIMLLTAVTVLVAVLVIHDVTTSPRVAAGPLTIPGGEWISPKNGSRVSRTIHFAALAYPTNPGDPKIAYVNFTVSWAGRPGPWVIACKVVRPRRGNQYGCVWRPKHVPAGRLNISFDVYDVAGNHNNSPNGVHMVIYARRRGVA